MLAADYAFTSLHTSHIETLDHTGFEPVLGNAGDVHTVRQQSTMIDGALLALEETPNLRLISANVRDGLRNPITLPYLGQRVAIHVQFEATHLPSDATHISFHFTVDGQDHGRFGLTLYKFAGQGGFNKHFDSDGDGEVNGQDYGRFLRCLLGDCLRFPTGESPKRRKCKQNEA